MPDERNRNGNRYPEEFAQIGFLFFVRMLYYASDRKTITIDFWRIHTLSACPSEVATFREASYNFASPNCQRTITVKRCVRLLSLYPKHFIVALHQALRKMPALRFILCFRGNVGAKRYILRYELCYGIATRSFYHMLPTIFLP